MEVFLPKYDGYQTKFIMASHADRTAMSACYKNSEMTCVTCHNPHVSVKQTPTETFNNACKNCHNTNKNEVCSLGEQVRLAKNDNDCSSCHMPVSPSIDIPHVTIHDHYIRKPIPEGAKDAVEQFIGLANITNPKNNDPLIRTKAYLKFYEGFQSEARMLDSAAIFLAKVPAGTAKTEASIHLAFLKDDFNKITKISIVPTAVFQDPWNWYRVGEAFYRNEKWNKAENYFQKALEERPFNLDFKNKLGSVWMKQKKLKEAKSLFAQIIQENPTHIPALNNLGFVYLNEGNVKQANAFYEKALALNPDYVPALMNTLGVLLIKQDDKGIKKILDRVLFLEPTNEKALFLKNNPAAFK